MKYRHRMLSLVLAPIMLLMAPAFAEESMERTENEEIIEITEEADASQTAADAEPGAAAEDGAEETQNETYADDPAVAGVQQDGIEPDAAAEAGGEAQELTAPVITAVDAVEDDDGVWRFGADADELLFQWLCGGALSYHVVLSDADGETIHETETASAGLAVSMDLIKENALYTLRVTAYADGAESAGELAFAAARSDDGAAGADAGDTDEEEGSNTAAADESGAEASVSGVAGGSKSGGSGKAKGGSGTSGRVSSSGSGGSSGGSRRGSSGGSRTDSSRGRSGGTSGARDAESTGAEETPGTKVVYMDAVSGVTLDAGASTYDAELTGTTLRLAPCADGAEWTIDRGALDALYADGVRTLELALDEEVYTLRLSAPEAADETRDGEGAGADEAGYLTEESPELVINGEGITVAGQGLLVTLAQAGAAPDAQAVS